MEAGVMYLVGSGVLAAVSVVYMNSQLNHTLQSESDITIALTTNLPLFPSISLVLFNFVLSIILCTYLLLRFTFFGSMSSVTITERQIIVEKLFTFFSFKFVLIGLIVEPGIIDMIVWIYWCANLALAKAIIQHGLIHAEHLANASASPKQYIRPSCHILFTIIFCYTACKSYGSYVASATYPHAFWPLFLFDLLTLLIEMGQSCAVYVLYITNALPYKVFVDPIEKASSVHIVADIILLHVTLIHFVYVSFVNGLTLSLVDVLLFLNIRSTFLQLFKKVNELRAIWATRRSIDSVFPTCEVVRNVQDINDDNCPICLASFDKAKRLPCDHHIHADCLMQLMRRASFVRKSDLTYTIPTVSDSTMDNTNYHNVNHTNQAPLYAPQRSRGYFTELLDRFTSSVYFTDKKATLVFPCPLCRKEIDLYSGALVQRKDTSAEQHVRGSSDSLPSGDANNNLDATNDGGDRNHHMSFMDTFFQSIRSRLRDDMPESADDTYVDPHTMINMLSEMFPQYSHQQLEQAVRGRFSTMNLHQIIEELLSNPLTTDHGHDFQPPSSSSSSSTTFVSPDNDGLYRLVGTFVDSTDEMRVDQREHDEFHPSILDGSSGNSNSDTNIEDSDACSLGNGSNIDCDHAATVAPGAFHGTGRLRRRTVNNYNNDGGSAHAEADDNNAVNEHSSGYWLTSLFGSR